MGIEEQEQLENLAKYACALVREKNRNPLEPKMYKRFTISRLKRQFDEDEGVIKLLQEELTGNYYSEITSGQFSTAEGRRYTLRGWDGDVRVDVINIHNCPEPDGCSVECLIYNFPLEQLTVGMAKTINRIFPKLKDYFSRKWKNG